MVAGKGAANCRCDGVADGAAGDATRAVCNACDRISAEVADIYVYNNVKGLFTLFVFKYYKVLCVDAV